MIFDLSRVTDHDDLQLAEETLYSRCDFPWSRMLGGLRASVGRSTIPILFSDLTRFAGAVAEHGGHPHIHEAGEKAHVLQGRGAPTRTAVRQAVWGLAWYSGRVEVERTLPTWAKRETLLAEAAHMVDFFYLTPEHRAEVDLIFHGGPVAEHGHEWFDNSSYWADVGESFMEGFVHGFSTLPDTGDWGFTHEAHLGHGPPIREAVLELHAPQVFGLEGSAVVHDSHRGIGPEIVWPSLDAAKHDGRRGCRVCKP